jgi:UDP-N-acetylmuramoyl-tripeptide--D-alanyl-D-alanine ligase
MASSERPVWAVLGPMAELGPATEAAHVDVGRLAADLAFDGVIVLGAEGADIARGAGSIATPVSSPDEAADAVIGLVPPGALVLVKASRVVSLERFPDILRARLLAADRKA